MKNEIFVRLRIFSDLLLPDCVASSTSGQKASAEMRDFDLPQAPCRGSEVDEQTRISEIHGGAEDRDLTRGGPARRDGERGVPAAWFGTCNVTAHPSAAWTLQQLREAVGFERYEYLLHDRDSIFAKDLDES